MAGAADVLRAVALLAVRMLRGAAWGAVIGVGIAAMGRTVMRGVAIAGGLEPTWSAGFSLHLLVLIATVNAAIGLSYAVIRDVMPGGRRRGLVGGVLLLFLAGYPALIGELHEVVGQAGLAAAVGGVTAMASLFLLDVVWLEAVLRPRPADLGEPTGSTRPAALAAADLAAAGAAEPDVAPAPPDAARLP